MTLLFSIQELYADATCILNVSVVLLSQNLLALSKYELNKTLSGNSIGMKLY